jgi:hypothetical protein
MTRAETSTVSETYWQVGELRFSLRRSAEAYARANGLAVTRHVPMKDRTNEKAKTSEAPVTTTDAPNIVVPSAATVESRRERPSSYQRVAVNGAMVLGAALVAWSGAIHLHLWIVGYRHIRIIGPLFLAQAISAFIIALAVVVSRWASAALVGAALLASTSAGLLLSAWRGVFGFQDSLGSPFAGLSLLVEGAGIVVLAGAAVGRLQLRRQQRSQSPAISGRSAYSGFESRSDTT